ncbi:MAG TPA: C40 family peptidase, partial [Thermomicrobiales bacterium]|nr:C40 family peptidase [Thermomicrobiales bacterium]
MRTTLTRSRRVLALVAIALVASTLLMLPASADPNLSLGGLAMVVDTNGDGLNLRTGPSTGFAVQVTMPEGSIVQVVETGLTDDTGLGWTQVRYSGLTGYAATMYLAAASGLIDPPPVAPDPPAADPQPNGLAAGSRATVSGTGGDGLNVRSAPGTSATVLTAIHEGARVTILGGPEQDASGNSWYQIETVVVGWAHGSYLIADDPAVAPDPVDPPAGGTSEPPPAASAAGQALVDEAMLHYGTPYVWAGTTPGSFDCSGFTYYVVNTVLQNNFPRALSEQVMFGVFVSRSELQPGDLVFFQNTYEWGLSHVGIYTGNGMFINAGNEDDHVG